MNDRSQGGSSLKEGRIELMQNRRLFFDDWKGVNEALNETDSFGNGIQVPAKYTMYLRMSKDMVDIQRGLQGKLDHPLQVLQVRSVEHSYDSDNRVSGTVAAYMGVFNHLDFVPVKLQIQPHDKFGQLAVRIENLLDYGTEDGCKKV